ncbi:hypothetical protein TNCV_4883701 [Trichonephila clavipes]|nr:hypothetical protein TNCV_4883701 [Trichonephila clavipes]
MLSDRRCHIEAHEIHRGKGLLLRLLLAVALSTVQVRIRFGFVLLNFERKYLRVARGYPISFPFPPTSRKNLRLDEYLEFPMPHRQCTIINIHAFSGVRTQALRHSSQCLEPLYRMGGIRACRRLVVTRVVKL